MLSALVCGPISGPGNVLLQLDWPDNVSADLVPLEEGPDGPLVYEFDYIPPNDIVIELTSQGANTVVDWRAEGRLTLFELLFIASPQRLNDDLAQGLSTLEELIESGETPNEPLQRYRATD